MCRCSYRWVNRDSRVGTGSCDSYFFIKVNPNTPLVFGFNELKHTNTLTLFFSAVGDPEHRHQKAGCRYSFRSCLPPLPCPPLPAKEAPQEGPVPAVGASWLPVPSPHPGRARWGAQSLQAVSAFHNTAFSILRAHFCFRNGHGQESWRCCVFLSSSHSFTIIWP